MMRLSTMWKVVQTVGEDWKSLLAEQILQPWGFDEGTVYYFRASANFIFVFRQDGKRRFLRFSARSEQPLGAIEAEVRLVTWLDRQGVPVASPIRSRMGRLVETVDTALGRFHAVVFAEAEGVHLEADDCQAEQFEDWGAALGRLHAALRRYQDPSAGRRPTWRDHLEVALPYVQDDPAMLTEWNCLQEWAGSLPTGADDFGLIHFDFESDNLCWKDGRITALDFDDSAHYWYVADIAYALRDLFREGVDLADPRFGAFVRGYARETHLNRDLLAQLPLFLRLHEMYRYGRYSRVLDVPPDSNPPTWLTRIDAKLRRGLEEYRGRLAATRT